MFMTNNMLRSTLHKMTSSTRRFGALALSLALFALALTPATANAWWNGDWAYRKAITVDPVAAGIAGEVGTVPVLLRLHEGVFRFPDAAPEGADLRFVAEDDKTPLKFHIERYDEVFNIAFVWVQVPVTAGKPTPIWMYYGNPKTTGESDSRATYDADQMLVYHFSERSQPAMDASGNGNSGTVPFASVDSGLIGGAARIRQTALALPLELSAALAQRPATTWSMWVKPAVAESDGVIYSQREGEASLRLALAHGVPYLAITGNAGEAWRVDGTAATVPDRWTHLAVVSGPNNKVTLYVDGKPIGSADARIVQMKTAAVIGGEDAQSLAATFDGEVDELQVSRTERSAAWLQLAAINQGTEDKLVAFAGDEAKSTFSTGYVGIIMHSVTLDGWVIIAVLIVMMFISFAVMAAKGSQISGVAKANAAFLELFRLSRGDFLALHHKLDGDSNDIPREQRLLSRKAPLMQMFRTGVEELRDRLHGESRGGMRNGVISAQSIEAIRAAIDSKMIREVQSLNKRMVLLTIAISGGPFIGLLGTVVGVMITFAAVAQAGDVNVNAIAPGIAAALAATVAGLFVAIPALFGYNYLLIRIKEINAEMQVFVDAFITRMAENYNSPDGLHALANDRA